MPISHQDLLKTSQQFSVEGMIEMEAILKIGSTRSCDLFQAIGAAAHAHLLWNYASLYPLFALSVGWKSGIFYIVGDIVPMLGYFVASYWLCGSPGIQRYLVEPATHGDSLLLLHLSYTVGSILWGYFEVITHAKPFPSLADIAYLGYYPLMLFGCSYSSLNCAPLKSEPNWGWMPP